MSRPPKKRGLPKSVQEAIEREEGEVPSADTPSLEEFVNDMHGDHATAKPVEGIPSVEWLQDTFKTKSAIIRYLVSQSHEVKTIAKHLGMRYQHVRNVATSTLKRGPNEDWRKPYLEGTTIPDSKDFKPKKD
jgi:hypothetical protein